MQDRLADVQHRLADLQQRYDHLVLRTHGLICTHDLDGKILSVNPAAMEILGYTDAEMVGHNPVEFLPEAARERFDVFLDNIRQNEADKGKLLILAKDGGIRVFVYHNVRMAGPEGDYVLGYAYDVTELTELQRKLEELTVTDDLTGVYNRRGFLSRMEDRISLARRHNDSLALIFADVDGLKAINDTHGHATGSRVIIETAEILRDSCRQTDLVSRWGGDEFVVLLGHSRAGGTAVVLERIRRKIDHFNKAEKRPYTLSVSFGFVAVDPHSEVLIADLVAEADKRMYGAKRERP